MELIAPLLDWIAANSAFAGLILFLIAFSESLAIVGLFMPGAVLMFGAGALMGTGHIDFWSGAAWAVAGAIVGDGVSFLLGRYFGGRLGSVWPFRSRPHLLPRATGFFRRHGGKSVLLGRFVGPMRPIIPAVAGMLEMPAGRFFAANIFSALLWAPAYLIPGMVFAASLGLAAAVAGRLLVLVVLLLAAGYLGYLLLRQFVLVLLRTPLGQSLSSARYRWPAALLLLGLPLALLAWRYHPLVTQPPVAVDVIAAEHWRQAPWSALPERRQGLQRPKEPFALQWAGSLGELEAALTGAGWAQPDAVGVTGVLRWLSPEPELANLPPRWRWHEASLPDQVWVTAVNEQERLVLRLWQAPLVLAERGTPVWLGSLERERFAPGWPWLEYHWQGHAAPTDQLLLPLTASGEWVTQERRNEQRATSPNEGPVVEPLRR